MGLVMLPVSALALCCCAALGGCSESPPAPARTEAAAQQARSEALARRQLTRVAEEPPANAVQGEVPAAVMQRIRRHLAARTGAAAESFEVVRAEWQQWPSGAMGCPQPGVIYTQALVTGYWVVLQHEGRDYDYRVAESGHFVVCESTLPERPPTR